MLVFECADCGEPREFGENTKYGVRIKRRCYSCHALRTFERVEVGA